MESFINDFRRVFVVFLEVKNVLSFCLRNNAFPLPRSVLLLSDSVRRQALLLFCFLRIKSRKMPKKTASGKNFRIYSDFAKKFAFFVQVAQWI